MSRLVQQQRKTQRDSVYTDINLRKAADPPTGDAEFRQYEAVSARDDSLIIKMVGDEFFVHETGPFK